MGRKSRQKKLKRKQKIEARLRELSHAQRKGLIHQSVQLPLEDLTYEDRTQLLRDRGEEAKERFDVIFPEVRSRILEFDPILLLSVLSAYSQFSEFGHDSEIHDEDMVGQAHIELLQALALQQNLSGFEFRPLPSSEAFDFRKQVAELFQVQLQSMWAQFDSTISDREMRKRMLLSMLRENTRMVRNWAYFHQLRHIVSSLFSSFDKDIQKELGVGVNELWQMLENIMHRMEEYLNDRMKRLAPLMKKRSLHSVVRYYFEIFPETQGTPDQLVVAFKEKSATVEQAKWMLLMHADLHLPDAFTFTIDDFVNACPGDVDAEKLSKVLGKWSLAFGDLALVNPEHLFLANPIWKKPLIALEQGVYFWPIPGLLNSCLALIQRFEKRCAGR